MVLGGGGALAGTCALDSDGVFICAGAADADVDTTAIILDTGSGVEVRTEEGFGISVRNGGALELRAVGNNNLSFVDSAHSDITSEDRTSIIASVVDGDLAISSNGTVTGAGAIEVQATGTGNIDVNVSNLEKTDSVDGAVVQFNANGGDVSVRSDGLIFANTGGGIDGVNGPGNIMIDVNRVVATGDEGIALRGGREVSIISSNEVSGSVGILVQSDSSNPTDVVDIDVQDVSGANGPGIRVFSDNDVTIATHGRVTGGSSSSSSQTQGIFVQSGGEISIETNDEVLGTGQGIQILATGNETVSVNAQSSVTGTANDGIHVFSREESEVFISSAAQIAGERNGIDVEQRRGGNITIDTADVLSNTQRAISANVTGRGDVDITSSGSVSGGSAGIQAVIEGNSFTGVAADGTISVVASGTIEGGAQGGINLINETDNGSVIVDLLNGASVSSVRGPAIRVNSSLDPLSTGQTLNTDITLRAGSEVEGSVVLFGSNDTLTIHDGANIEDAEFNGVDGDEDEVIFSSYRGALALSLFENWEILTARDGAEISALDEGLEGFETIRVKTNSIVTVQLDNDDVPVSFDGGLEVDASGRFIISGSGNGRIAFSGDIVNGGFVSLVDEQWFDQLDVGGNIAGNGTIALDVDLNTGQNDEVVVQGDSEGASIGLEVVTSGASSETPHSFTLVTVGGASTQSDFQLVNGDFVTNDGAQAISDGDTSYRLEYNSVAGTFDLNPFGTNGDVMTNPGGDFLAATVQQISDQMSFDSTLNRIFGTTDLEDAEAETVSRALTRVTSTTQPLVWISAEGERDSYSFNDRDVVSNSGGLLIGAGLPLADVAGGRLIGGVEIGVNNLSSDVTTPVTGADINTNAYEATLSALWVASNQFYVDGQMRYASFDSSIRPDGGQKVNADSSGYGLSIEIGKPVGLDNGLTLVPQFQLMYSDIDTDEVYNLAGGDLTGTLEDGDTVTARLGVRTEKELASASVLFGQVDYYHGFDNETSVSFGQNSVVTARAQNTLALTVGGQVALSDRTRLYGEISGGTGLGSNSDDHTIGGNVRFEVRF